MNKTITGEVNKNEVHPDLFAHNLFIVWKPDFNLGIPIIDEHHRGIVSVINSLYFGIKKNYVDDMLTPIIDMMKDYTHIHFEIEERFLEMTSYPHTEKHLELHIELSTKLAKMKSASVLGKDPYKFMDFLKEWWINHICCEDLKFKDHIKKYIEQ